MRGWIQASCFFIALLAEAQERPEARPSLYSGSTIIVCNAEMPESRELAEYYAAGRGIDPSQIIALSCPKEETISREDYAKFVAQPLRSALLEGDWWKLEENEETGQQTLRSRIHFLTLMHGMPLKIADDSGAPADSTGEGYEKTTAASLESELALLGQPGKETPGPLSNPYFQQEQAFHEAQLPILLVGRIDGPNADSCRRLMDDALRAEASGLWGMAYLDLDDHRAEPGNAVFLAAGTALRKQGIPVTTNAFADEFPPHYPMQDPIFYFGWHVDSAEDSFLGSDFRFRPGAVAAHLHAFSAETLRDPEARWAAPLLEAGASAVVGNANDPFLEFSHRFDLLADRLSRGFTFLESAWMSNPAISWMGVAVGDPLYQPFPRPGATIDEARLMEPTDRPYKILRVARERWGEGQEFPTQELFFKMEFAAVRAASPIITEEQALLALAQGEVREARTQFYRARTEWEGNPAAQIRILLHLADMDRREGDLLAALRTLDEAIILYGENPAAETARILLGQLAPDRPIPKFGDPLPGQENP